MRRSIFRRRERKGSTLVESALVLPLYFLFLFGFIEFVRAFMIIQMINSAAREGASMGALDGVSSAEVEARIREFLAAGNIKDGVQVQILDASPYDELEDGEDPPSASDLTEIADLTAVAPRHLLIVRITVPFNQTTWMNPWYLTDSVFVGQTAMRHE